MLTYPSDSLHQIVCPMDEHAIPPNSFCSAPPHSEPPPPLLPFSSVTPSCAKNGISGHGRSGRIQEIQEAQTPNEPSVTDDGAAQEPSRQNLAPTKRQRERANMVSQSKQQRVEGTDVREKQTEDEFDVSFAAECQNKQNDRRSPEIEENAVEQFAVDSTQNLETTKPDMDTCRGLAVGHSIETASAPKGWVIGPLFQSFKSKMASFTEIVMTPVKLFRSNTSLPCVDLPDKLDESELPATETSDVEHSEPSHVFPSEGLNENANEERLSEVDSAQNSKTVALKYSKRLSFDVELPTNNSEQADECAITQKEKNSPDSVPLQRRLSPIVCEEVSESVGSSILLQPSLNISASHETKLNVSGAIEDQKGKLSAQLKPLPRKCSVNRSGVKKVTSKTSTSKGKKEESVVSDEQFSHMNSVKSNKADSVCCAQPDTDCPQPDDDDDDDGEDDGRKIESLDRPSHLNNLNDGANGGTLKPSLATQQLDCQINPENYSASVLGRTKRGVELDCRSQDFVKRKRLTADTCTKDTKRQAVLNVASDIGILRPQRREVVTTNPIVHKEDTLKPVRKISSVSTRANKKGKNGQDVIAAINETVLITQTESYSLDKSSGVSENSLKGSSSKGKPRGSCNKPKTRTGLGKPDVNIDNGMELETSMAIASTKQAEQETASEVLTRPGIKPLQSSSKRRNINKKPVKRKSPGQSSSTTESDGTLFSTSSALSMEPLDLTPADLNASRCVQKEEGSKKGLNQPSKRTKRGFRVDVKVSASGGSQEPRKCTHELNLRAKENQPNERGQLPMDPVYFEMTPFESIQQPSSSQPNLNGSVQSNNEVKHVTAGKENSTASVSDEVFTTDAEASNHSSISVSGSSARRVNIKPRRTDKKRRKSRVLHSRTSKEGTNSTTMANADLATASSQDLSRRLLRSYSCPEIPSLHLHDTPWTSALHSPHHSRCHTTHQSSHTPVHHAHKYLQRARRHTVCSVEVEREIAPLCLRKEVYPSRRSLPYDRATHNLGLSPSLALSPSTSLAALASCFLSSPLAFLSKKVDSRAATSPSTSSHVSSPTSSSPRYPMVFLERIDLPASTSLDYGSSGNLLACEMERTHQSEEDDGENTSSSSQEFEDVGLREEKALSDSEIKVVQKHEERGKVSSIRIRKTLPKPQNNLTPMGLPRPIRLKKKEFSLEEIYTNKNFNKPPESRLETIFEVPLSRRDGSESWYSQRRVKRYLEFLDAGEVRKPKKPLVGVGKAGTSSRTRRGGFPKDQPPLSVQDVDSLLCAKLDQLNLWLINDHKDS